MFALARRAGSRQTIGGARLRPWYNAYVHTVFRPIIQGTTMDTAAILNEFEDAQAILRGHFVLSSGLHSDTYMQCARVMMDAARGERLCNALGANVHDARL